MKAIFFVLLAGLLSGTALAQAAASNAGREETALQVQRGPAMRFGPSNTPGWSMMTPREREEHRQKMMSFKNVADCRAYHDEHFKQMQERAKERNRSLKPLQADPCEMMQKRGYWRK